MNALRVRLAVKRGAWSMPPLDLHTLGKLKGSVFEVVDTSKLPR